MAEKKVTKTVAKKATAKKTVVKPAAKKTTVKKAPAKKTVATKKVAPVVEMPTPDVKPYPCGCGHDCKCGGNCKCHKGGFFKKFILILIIFALGFVSAKMCCCKKFGKMGPRPEFDNGCLVVKCPKLANMVPMMDADHDGCVTKEEFKAAKKQMRKHPSAPAEMPAPAPQVEVIE